MDIEAFAMRELISPDVRMLPLESLNSNMYDTYWFTVALSGVSIATTAILLVIP